MAITWRGGRSISATAEKVWTNSAMSSQGVTSTDQIRFRAKVTRNSAYPSSVPANLKVTSVIATEAVVGDAVYTHPTHPGDDINIDTGALTGATVISDLDFNVTTDTEGHVTDANGTVATRTLTAANIGAAAASHTHTIANVTGLQTALDAKAPLASPNFTGTVSLTSVVDGVNQINTGANTYLRIDATTAGANGLDFYNSANQRQGLVYSDGSGTFGLLHSGGGWAVQIAAGSNAVTLPGTVTMNGTANIGTQINLNTNTHFTQGASTELRVTTNHGYIEIGPKNTTYCHIYTDRGNFYFNNGIYATGPMRIQESASPDGSSSGFHQIWARNDAPSTLWSQDDATSVNQPIGFNGARPITFSTSQNMLKSQVGAMLTTTTASLQLTCAQDSTTWDGATWLVHNDSTGNLTIAAGTNVTVYWLEGGSAPAAGSVVVAQGGIVSVYKRSNTEFWVWGAKSAGAGGGITDVVQDTTPQLGGDLDMQTHQINVGAATRQISQPTLRGTINVGGTADNGGIGSYHGYSINNDIMFMHNGSAAGIYDEVQNHWKIRFDTNTDQLVIYHGANDVFKTQAPNVAGNSSGATLEDHELVARDVGFNDLRLVEINPPTTFTTSDEHNGGCIYADDNTAFTMTLATSTTTHPVGSVIQVINANSSVAITISDGGNASYNMFYLDGSSRTDVATSCTLAAGGMATIIRTRTSSTTLPVWVIFGSGITA